MASIPHPIPTKFLPRANPVLSSSPSLLNRSVLFGDVSGLAARSRRVRYNSKGGVGRKSWSSPTSLVRAVLELEGTAPALKPSGVTRRQRRDDRSKVANLEDIISERGACGVGFIANLRNEASHKTVEDALTALGCMEHRGGCGADNASGDGSGVMTSVPWDLFNNWANEQGIASLDKSNTGVGMVFLPKDEKHMKEAKTVIMNTFLEEGLEVLGWRPVPVNASIVGFYAKETMPNIEQVFVRVSKEENVDDI